MIFKPNCSTRMGSPIAFTFAELANDEVTQQVCAKSVLVTAGEPVEALRGFSKFGRFSTLKNSARS